MQDAGSDPENRLEGDGISVNNDPTGFGEHDRNPGPYPRLHLAEPPIRPVGVAHDHSRLEELGHEPVPLAAATLAGANGIEGEELDTSGLVGARIYHDIINPLGAIGNGVQLLGLTGQTDSAVLELISQSVETSMARLKLLRLAFGNAGERQERPGSEVAALLSTLSRNGRQSYDWRIEEMLPAPMLRLLLLCTLCLESAFATGGRFVIAARGDVWSLRAEGQRQRDLPELWRLFEGRSLARTIEPANLQFALAPRRAAEMGIQMTLFPSATALEILLRASGRRSSRSAPR